MKVSTPDTQHSSKCSWIWDTWRRSRIPISPSNPAKPSTCLTTAVVLRESSTTTKFRVVVDASVKTTSEVSFNDNMMLGPKVQKDLFDILIRFRFQKVVLSADIAELYCQILLDKEDKDFHRLLWKESPSFPLKHYCMTSNTYGVTSAGFHVIRRLLKLAETTKHPAVSFGLKFDMYVDDLLTGASSQMEAKALQDVLIEHLATAGFQLPSCPQVIFHLSIAIPKAIGKQQTPST